MRCPGTLPTSGVHRSARGPSNIGTNGTAPRLQHHSNHSLRRNNVHQPPTLPTLPTRGDSCVERRIQQNGILGHPPLPTRHPPPCPQSSSYPTLPMNGHASSHHQYHHCREPDRDRSRDRNRERDVTVTMVAHREKHRDTLDQDLHDNRSEWDRHVSCLKNGRTCELGSFADRNRIQTGLSYLYPGN